MRVKEELEAADGEAGVGRDGQIGLAGAVSDDAGGPALLEEQLMAAIALEDESLQLGIAVVSGDAEVESDFLNRPDVGERQPVVKARHNCLRARLQRESGRQGRSYPVVMALRRGFAAQWFLTWFLAWFLTWLPFPIHPTRRAAASSRSIAGATRDQRPTFRSLR